MFTIKNAAGEIVAGDPRLDQAVKRAADEVGGWVENEDGGIVYASPGHPLISTEPDPEPGSARMDARGNLVYEAPVPEVVKAEPEQVEP